MIRTGLIGHTGFVGSTLDKTIQFSDQYNSKNIDDIAGRDFDLLICAGVRAEKWLANQDPENDWRNIEAVIARLETVTAREFILISTIDVYPDPASRGDEAEVIDADRNHAYGRHRFQLEQWAREKFPVCRIVRLAGLFGPGMKKNMIFDLMTGNMVDRINPTSCFQWYPIVRLAGDIEIVRRGNLDLVNLFPEPLPTDRILTRLFPQATTGPAERPAAQYDVRTRHADIFGGGGGYMMSEDASLAALEAYAQNAGRVLA